MYMYQITAVAQRGGRGTFVTAGPRKGAPDYGQKTQKKVVVSKNPENGGPTKREGADDLLCCLSRISKREKNLGAHKWRMPPEPPNPRYATE